MPIGSISPAKVSASDVRHREVDALLTDPVTRTIIDFYLRKQSAGGRHQIGTPARFRSELVADFRLEYMADIVGIRTTKRRARYLAPRNRANNPNFASLIAARYQPNRTPVSLFLNKITS